jgi:carboxylesterase
MARIFPQVNPQLPGDPFFWEGGPVGVLLVHGFTATPAEVHPLGQYLHARGFTVAGPLLPGHGTTPQELNRTRGQDWVEAVEASYRQLVARCDTVFLGGESLGGMLALYLASEHPQAVGILAYAPALITAPSYGPYLLPLLAPFIPYVPKPSHPTQSPADERWQGYPVNPARAVGQLYRLQRLVRRRLPLIRQPILIVQGRLDEVVHPSVPDRVYRAVKSTLKEVHRLANSHHCVLLDGEWEQAAQWTLDFIQRVVGIV